MGITFRTQNDGLQDIVSDVAGIDCSADPDLVRQEDGPSADLNKLIPKFGSTLPMRPPVFGTVDFRMDLQQNLNIARDLREGYARLPLDLRSSYKNWDEIVQAIDFGELRIHPTEEPSPEPLPPA